jgi:5,10-methylenetetrahydromethanopterin reductase
VRTSLRLNNDVSPERFIRVAQVAEDAGFDQIWVSNDLFLRAAPVLLTAAARHTTRIGLGTCILNPYSMHPAEIAMTAATLQEVSSGRFRLGIAAGAQEFLGWAGIVRAQPLARTREAVVAVRTLLAGGRPARVPGAGEGWHDEAHLRVPAAPAPIYVGGMSPKMLELAGEVADGVLPLLFPPEHFPTARDQVTRGALRAGRDPSVLDVAACIWCSVDERMDRAHRALAEKIVYYGPSFAPYLLRRAGLDRSAFDGIRAAMAAGDLERAVTLVTPPMLALGVAGSPEAIVERCQRLAALGARHLSFGPPLGPDVVRAVEILGARVLPALDRSGR